jgi:hypothetical protein
LVPRNEFTPDREGINKEISSNYNPENKKKYLKIKSTISKKIKGVALVRWQSHHDYLGPSAVQ